MFSSTREASARRLALQIDAERQRLEDRGVRAAVLFGSRARRMTLAAWQRGDDPTEAVRGTLLLLSPIVRDCMIAADLTGRLRTKIVTDRTRELGTVYDDAIDFLSRRLDLTGQQLDAMRAQYNIEALRVVKNAGDDLEHAVQATVVRLTEDGAGVREGIKEIRRTFEARGLTPEADYRLEGLFRTQTQLAYGAGRWNSLQDPAVQEALWGYEYVTVGDDRVRPNHEKMHGVKAPKDHPVWRKWWAPCGYNCRCTNLEIFLEDAPKTFSIPDVEPDKGFGFNPGKVFDVRSATVPPPAPKPTPPSPPPPALPAPAPVAPLAPVDDAVAKLQSLPKLSNVPGVVKHGLPTQMDAKLPIAAVDRLAAGRGVLTDVVIAELVATSRYASSVMTEQQIRTPGFRPSGNAVEKPKVMKKRGVLYLVEGTAQVLAAKLLGELLIEVLFVDAD